MTVPEAVGDAEPGPARGVRARSGRAIEQVALLTIAIVFGLLGFLAEPFWFVAIVIMAVLWGFQVSTLRPSARAGATPSAISTLVEGARDLATDVARASHENEHTPVATEPVVVSINPDVTRQELYEQAKRAGIPGRSSMTKDELRKALGS